MPTLPTGALQPESETTGANLWSSLHCAESRTAVSFDSSAALLWQAEESGDWHLPEATAGLCSRVPDVYKEKAQTKITSKTKERHKRKFDKLLTEQSHPQSYGSRKVVNLSTKQLDDTSWLSPRALIVPLHPRRSQLLILSPPLKLQSEGWGSVRQTVAAKTRISVIGAVSRTRMPPRNVPPKKMKALKNLACDEDILILPADKCKATMVMNKADYDVKMLTMLRDKNTYCLVKKDLTSPLERNMNSMLLSLKRSGQLPDGVHSYLRSSAGSTPQLYGLQKVHKQNVTICPIVSFVSNL